MCVFILDGMAFRLLTDTSLFPLRREAARSEEMPSQSKQRCHFVKKPAPWKSESCDTTIKHNREKVEEEVRVKMESERKRGKGDRHVVRRDFHCCYSLLKQFVFK